ncbi:hypothetical protein [Nitrosospira sp. Is2]|uniref:hypothetical protein n=1 Tax=Nitrosospira sp. Is2 TaxID=3080532 RepID=UPI00295575D9|nr:hypothetical protein [Nitrosospira sp. Is2]WON72896.1 hypothetical protein R5L00_10360 [Nitrosospira sp. Is2]
MEDKLLKTVPKISVKIWRPIIEAFDKKMEAACLRRDAYLNKVLEVELNWLDEEVSIPNSQASYDYVLGQLDQLDRKLVSLALSPELTTRLNEICSRKRIVRDAFFNRFFLLLAASPKNIDRLFFGTVEDKWRTEVWSGLKHEGPFFNNVFYPLESTIDPFWAIRSGLDMYTKDEGLEDYIEPTSGKNIRVKRDINTKIITPTDNLYTVIFDRKNLLGLNCYMPDWRIPGNEAEKEYCAKLDELLASLEL